jgi:hypothetical protein
LQFDLLSAAIVPQGLYRPLASPGIRIWKEIKVPMKPSLVGKGRVAGVFVLLVLLLTSAGCKKKNTLQMETIEQTPRLGLPVTLDHIWSFNIHSLVEQEFVRKIRADVEAAPEYTEKVGQVRDVLGIDPFEDINLLLIGHKGKLDWVNPFGNIFVIARGKFPDTKGKMERLHQYLANELLIDPDPFRQTRHPAGGFSQFSTSGQSQYNASITHEFHFAFPSEKIMIFSMNKGLVNESLNVMAGATPGIKENPEWLTKLSRPDTGAIIWGLGKITPVSSEENSPARNFNLEDLNSAKEYFASLKTAREFQVELGLLCFSIDTAKQLTDALKKQLNEVKKIWGMGFPMFPELASLPERVLVTTELDVSKIIVSLNEEQRHILKTEVSGMIEEKFAAPGPGVSTDMPDESAGGDAGGF